MAEEYADHHEEEDLGKAYDARLMKRLLLYAKPYWKFFLLAVLMLFASTVTDLARPYLIKVAIDDFIGGYSKPMAAYDLSSGAKGIEFDGHIFQRVRTDQKAVNQDRLYSIVYMGKTPYLLAGVIPKELQSQAGTILHPKGPSKVEIAGESAGFSEFYAVGNRQIPARELNKEEIRLFRKGDVQAVSVIGLLFIGVILLGFIFNYVQIYVLTQTGQTIIYNLRQEIFTHLQKMSVSFFDKNPVGRLVTRVTNDTETLNDMYTNVLVSLLKDISILLGTVIIMFSMNVQLSLVILAVIPLLIPITILFRIKARAIYRRVRVALARINSALSENISGMRVIQIFHREKEKLGEFETLNHAYRKALIDEVVVSGVFRPLIEMLAGFCIALILWYGGGKTLNGVLEFGVLYAFVNYISYFFQPINDLAEKYNILQSSMASSERIFAVLDTVPEADEGRICTDKALFKGSIEFKNVWFAYNGDEWVLKDVSFQVPPGKTVAIVGATGAGKTSIINLINRFYEIQKGEILIDGVNIRELQKDCLRRNIGVVLQDVFLFSGPIKENIRLNDENISVEALMQAADYVNAGKFIEGLSHGYEEEVMERGATFSSGQRQLLSFARTLAFDPSILILDEATASIDTETELLIQDALSKLTEDRTTIVIAHRLSTIQHADQILVLHKGRIREMGNHQELLAKKGMYYDLYQLQYKGE